MTYEWECDDCGMKKIPSGLSWCPACTEEADLAKVAKLHQVGGDHYTKRAIQPWDIIDQYGMNYYAGNALKYLLRYRDKGGQQDLKKARHYIDKLIEVTKED